MNDRESTTARLYRRIYEAICGSHPQLRPWHFQWSAARYLYRDFRHTLPLLRGRVLDVGCGGKPYESWLEQADDYVGLDIEESADVQVTAGKPWPLESESFDVVFSAQVLEHVADLSQTLSEIDRVLKLGGKVVLSLPFLFNEHGGPADYRRFTVHWAAQLLPATYEIEVLNTQGGIGSTLAIALLNWLDLSSNRYFASRLLKALLLPLWLVVSLILNVLGVLGDLLDKTDAFYNNVLIVARKKS